ncbi:unnamed protein product [Coregonus sp. 'balchen']|nr:unnamed protein product [Coregonus sp. 'balchen']
MEEAATRLNSITQSEEKHIALSYLIGKLTFVDKPKIYEHGSIIKGKINFVHFNNTPISDMLVYLLEKKGWSSHRLQNLTTDSHGIASFSLNTTSMPKENINLIVITEGEITLKLVVVPEMAPLVQVLVYSMLPSETVIAHSMNLPTEKCFRHKYMDIGSWGSSLSALHSEADLGESGSADVPLIVPDTITTWETEAFCLAPGGFNLVPPVKRGLLHWTKTYSETSASLAVEISSYVLLASLSASPLSTTDLGYASRIVRWLVRQQKAYGGFSSTQDTVVALQALALYSTRVFSREGTNTVTVQSPSGGQHLFDVNQNNKLLYQERAMQDTEWKYSVEMKGSACTCASVLLSENTPHNPMVALHYNIPTPIDSTTLSIKVKPEVDCNSNSETQSHAKTSISELPVQNLKPAVVKIYDYYQPVTFS